MSIDLTDAHARMVTDVHLVMEQRANRNRNASPEYDVQQLIADFYEDWFRNTRYAVNREKSGKVDVVVFRDGNEAVLYELKTYFKATERICLGPIEKDIKKLAKKKRTMPSCPIGYIMLAGRKKALGGRAVPSFVKAHLDNDRSYSVLPELEGIRLRPSRKRVRNGATFVMTWEVLLE